MLKLEEKKDLIWSTSARIGIGQKALNPVKLPRLNSNFRSPPIAAGRNQQSL